MLGMRETALFREDMEALRVLPPRQFIGAVEAIPEIAELVGKLLASGAAYRVDDSEYPDVYLRRVATGQFGYESQLRPRRRWSGCPGARRRPGPARQAGPAGRAALADGAPGEPAWESDLGRGPSGLARGVRRDRAEPARHRRSTSRAAART